MGLKTTGLCHGRKICVGLWNKTKSWLRKPMLWAQSGTSRVPWFSFTLGHWILQNNLGFLTCRASTATLEWNGEFGPQSSELWWCAAWNPAESSWEIKLKEEEGPPGGFGSQKMLEERVQRRNRASLWIVSWYSVFVLGPRLWERCSCASCVCS